jgi:hypothetical protein
VTIQPLDDDMDLSSTIAEPPAHGVADEGE